MANRRLNHEFKELNNDPDLNCYAEKTSSVHSWKVTMKGPPDTPYEDGHFVLKVEFSANHPFKPPIVLFDTKVYHPNINESGIVCIDILKSKWSPVLSISKIIASLQSLLAHPNPHDPLSQESADLYLSDIDEYNHKAKLWTEMYAQEQM